MVQNLVQGLWQKIKAQTSFKRMLQELGIKHLYTKPYKPQTNGKVERLWKTINDDLLENLVPLCHFQFLSTFER